MQRTSAMWAFTLLLSSLVVTAAPVGRAEEPSLEYKVKAAFLVKFVTFVDWPSGSFASPSSPIVLGVLAPDPFGGELDRIARRHTVGGHPLAVRTIRTAQEADHCHVLFIPGDAEADLTTVLAAARSAPMLTVTEDADFPTHCGIINLTIEQGGVRFQIDAGTASLRGLTISSRLLVLASHVVPERAREAPR